MSASKISTGWRCLALALLSVAGSWGPGSSVAWAQNNSNYCATNAADLFCQAPDGPLADPFAGDFKPLALDRELAVNNRGPLDGIYECSGFTTGADLKIVVSVNGRINGNTAFALAQIQPVGEGLFGWGSGNVQAAGGEPGKYSFDGTTHEGLEFSMVANVAADGSVKAKGDVRLRYRGPTIQDAVPSSWDCKSIW